MKRRRPYATWRRRAVRVLMGLLLAPVIALLVAAGLTPLPASLAERGAARTSVRYLDRNGHLLREVRADDGTRAASVPLGAVGDRVERAMLAAEDARFYAHPGVDPLAVVRAVGSGVRARRVVSGASTLTMQLARTVAPPRTRRTLLGKFAEAALALRIEASLSKREILTEYLNRVPFGPQLRGIDAASRYWFDKPPLALSWAEAATLAALPRGPTLYTAPARLPSLLGRRNRILARMYAAGDLSKEDLDRAMLEPLRRPSHAATFGAPHFVSAISKGHLDAAPIADAQEIVTSLDGDLQREAEEATLRVVRDLAYKHVSAASAVVVDNESGELLAYVGSPSFDDARALGQNDGVLALRQPGSTLKPFVYAVAMGERRMTPATLLPDLELHLPLANGVYAPNNYDGRFHGPVRLREALANSYNVPAVRVADEVGPERVLDLLHAFGMSSLRETPDSYGAAIALGDGEVRLLELARAYAILARRGHDVSLRAVRRVTPRGNRTPWVGPAAVPSAAGRAIVPESVADMLTDVLADRRARVASFGERNALELPFEVAAKTGTSKGYRDNWTVGYTREVTVAVWVGNFDGAPMEGVSGITGAGPLFRAVMTAAMRSRAPAPLVLHDPERTVLTRVCALSGDRAKDTCGHVLEEWLPAGHETHECTMHETLRIDVRNGLRAGPGCGPGVTASRVFEVFRTPYAEWAAAVGRADAPRAFSPACPGDGTEEHGSGLRVTYPHDGARFILDAERSAAVQTLLVRADTDRFDVFVNGALRGRAERGVFQVPLVRGEHTLRLVADQGRESAPVRFHVD